MRTIKFRAWNINTKRMSEWEEVRDEYGFLFLLENEVTVPMQYTGLKDKNDKEIFEGDIIACYSKSGELVYNHEVIIPRIYEEIWGNVEDAKCEIIGNIYENNELLK